MSDGWRDGEREREGGEREREEMEREGEMERERERDSYVMYNLVVNLIFGSCPFTRPSQAFS